MNFINKNIKNINIYFFSLGLLISIYASVMPIYYKTIDLTAQQIAILLSSIYIGSLIQPLFGYLSDKTQKPKLIIQILLGIFIILTTSLYFTFEFSVLLIVVILSAIVYTPLFSLSDNIISKFAKQYKVNYGILRVGASFGYGIALLLVLFVSNIYGYRSFLSILIIFAIIAMIKINEVDYQKVDTKSPQKSYKKNIGLVIKNKVVISFILLQILFTVPSGFKFSYQAIKLFELSDNPLIPSIALIFATLPEIIFMPFVAKVFKNFKVTTIFLIAIILNLAQIFIYSQSDNYYLLIIITMLHGFSFSLYLPTYSPNFRSHVNMSIIATVMSISETFKSFWSVIMSFCFIGPIYANYGINSTFLAIFIIMLISLIPLMYLRIKAKI